MLIKGKFRLNLKMIEVCMGARRKLTGPMAMKPRMMRFLAQVKYIFSDAEGL